MARSTRLAGFGSFPRRFVTTALGCLAASAWLYTGACSQGGGGAGGVPDDIVYEGEATDEALEALLDAPLVTDPAQACVVTSPTEGAALASSPPATFTFGPAGMSAHVAPGLRAPAVEPSRGPAWDVSPLLELVGPVRTASAHGTPVNGRGYYLVFEGSAGELLHVFTLDPSYTPTEAAWGELTAASGPLKVTCTSAIFESNLIAEDGGPWQGSPRSFTIAP